MSLHVILKPSCADIRFCPSLCCVAEPVFSRCARRRRLVLSAPSLTARSPIVPVSSQHAPATAATCGHRRVALPAHRTARATIHRHAGAARGCRGASTGASGRRGWHHRSSCGRWRCRQGSQSRPRACSRLAGSHGATSRPRPRGRRGCGAHPSRTSASSRRLPRGCGGGPPAGA